MFFVSVCWKNVGRLLFVYKIFFSYLIFLVFIYVYVGWDVLKFVDIDMWRGKFYVSYEIYGNIVGKEIE